jgi:hypothetical protein
MYKRCTRIADLLFEVATTLCRTLLLWLMDSCCGFCGRVCLKHSGLVRTRSVCRSLGGVPEGRWGGTPAAESPTVVTAAADPAYNSVEPTHDRAYIIPQHGPPFVDESRPFGGLREVTRGPCSPFQRPESGRLPRLHPLAEATNASSVRRP